MRRLIPTVCMKILVAEDDLVTREILKRILTHMSDEILEANNGVEALEMIERHDPDFLFTDIQMPLLDGLAVVEAVRSSRTHSMLPIVCMSSVKDKDDITRLVSLGIADYILKPLRPGGGARALSPRHRAACRLASTAGGRGADVAPRGRFGSQLPAVCHPAARGRLRHLAGHLRGARVARLPGVGAQADDDPRGRRAPDGLRDAGGEPHQQAVDRVPHGDPLVLAGDRQRAGAA
ncbi:MAG: response regulator [Gemmatimonadetes bacterium]|nr:response regulator [Gemmatimonadota bacterium]